MLICVFAIVMPFILRFTRGDDTIRCGYAQTKYDKVIGVQPSARSRPLYFSGDGSPITFECIQRCTQIDDCFSFVLNYKTLECHYFNKNLYPDFRAQRLDVNVVWFIKMCTAVPVHCSKKMWIFERVPGAVLVDRNAYQVPENVTQESCEENCLNSARRCRSAVFTAYTPECGSCKLSYVDRHINTISFRASGLEEQYIENQCTSPISECTSYEEYEDTVYDHADVQIQNMDGIHCRKACDQSVAFNCRGYTVVNDLCLLHSEDSKLHGPKLLKDYKGATYFEKASCLNITVKCTAANILITYYPNDLFFGRLYASGYSETIPCYTKGRGNITILQLPLKMEQCGVTKAHSQASHNRTLLSVNLIIQQNALIQTQADRLVKVGCLFESDDEVTLGTQVNFTTSYPNKGSTLVNTSSVFPTVHMRVIDLRDHVETVDTQIGQQLQLTIEIQPADGPYDIQAGHLVASTENGQDSILLLDERGCPTDPNIFPAFQRVTTPTSRQLVATFQAFKFTTSPVVRFSAIVHFCTLICPPLVCPVRRGKRSANSTDAKVDAMALETILVVRSPAVSTDRLIYGENGRILIAGYDSATNEVCFDYSLLLGILIAWLILQIVILTVCILLIRRYKKYLIAYKRQEELHRNFSLGNETLSRRVRWADQSDTS